VKAPKQPKAPKAPGQATAPGAKKGKYQSKTGNAECSNAMSVWQKAIRSGNSPGQQVYAKLAQCRASVRTNKQNANKVAAGSMKQSAATAVANRSDRRIASDVATAKSRKDKLKSLVQARATRQISTADRQKAMDVAAKVTGDQTSPSAGLKRLQKVAKPKATTTTPAPKAPIREARSPEIVAKRSAIAARMKAEYRSQKADVAGAKHQLSGPAFRNTPNLSVPKVGYRNEVNTGESNALNQPGKSYGLRQELPEKTQLDIRMDAARSAGARMAMRSAITAQNAPKAPNPNLAPVSGQGSGRLFDAGPSKARALVDKVRQGSKYELSRQLAQRNKMKKTEHFANEGQGAVGYEAGRKSNKIYKNRSLETQYRGKYAVKDRLDDLREKRDERPWDAKEARDSSPFAMREMARRLKERPVSPKLPDDTLTRVRSLRGRLPDGTAAPSATPAGKLAFTREAMAYKLNKLRKTGKGDEAAAWRKEARLNAGKGDQATRVIAKRMSEVDREAIRHNLPAAPKFSRNGQLAPGRGKNDPSYDARATRIHDRLYNLVKNPKQSISTSSQHYDRHIERQDTLDRLKPSAQRQMQKEIDASRPKPKPAPAPAPLPPRKKLDRPYSGQQRGSKIRNQQVKGRLEQIRLARESRAAAKGAIPVAFKSQVPKGFTAELRSSTSGASIPLALKQTAGNFGIQAAPSRGDYRVVHHESGAIADWKPLARKDAERGAKALNYLTQRAERESASGKKGVEALKDKRKYVGIFRNFVERKAKT
jgi:hypothetical protein